MIVLKPMPGELGVAHAGRVAYINGLTSLDHLRSKTLGKAINHRKRNEFRQQFKVLATCLGIDPEAYLAEHSLLPFWYAYPGLRRSQFDGYQTLVASWLKPADGPLLDTLRFCMSCAQDDEQNNAFSWWRREHQMPGVDICIRHGTPLFRVKYTREMDRLPDSHIRTGDFTQEHAPNQNDEIVEKYRSFSTLLLADRHGITPADMRYRIGQRCVELGIVRDTRKRSFPVSSLSLYVRSRFPRAWLDRHYPVLLKPEYGGRDLQIDAVFNGQQATGKVIAMVLASLFDEIKDVELETTQPEFYSGRGEPVSNPSDSITDFVRVFVNAEGNSKLIAATLGCSVSKIHLLRRRFGLPIIPRTTTPTHYMVDQKLLLGNERDLWKWGNAMKAYWDSVSNAKKIIATDLAEFAKILAEPQTAA